MDGLISLLSHRYSSMATEFSEKRSHCSKGLPLVSRLQSCFCWVRTDPCIKRNSSVHLEPGRQVRRHNIQRYELIPFLIETQLAGWPVLGIPSRYMSKEVLNSVFSCGNKPSTHHSIRSFLSNQKNSFAPIRWLGLRNSLLTELAAKATLQFFLPNSEQKFVKSSGKLSGKVKTRNGLTRRLVPSSIPTRHGCLYGKRSSVFW